MKTKLENLISLEDFKANWRAEQAKKTKRTETGLDILKEGLNDDLIESDFDGRMPHNEVEEIIPEGRPESSKFSKYGLSSDDKVESIKDLLDSEIDDDVIDNIVNYLREAFLDMGESDFCDELDEKHDGDWKSWIEDAIEFEGFSEDVLDGILDITAYDEVDDLDDLDNLDDLDDDIDSVECPDCEGTGSDEDDDDCERCEGTGRIDRPGDMPSDDWTPEHDDDDDED